MRYSGLVISILAPDLKLAKLIPSKSKCCFLPLKKYYYFQACRVVFRVRSNVLCDALNRLCAACVCV